MTLHAYSTSTAPLIGGAIYYFCLSASTGVLQTASPRSLTLDPVPTPVLISITPPALAVRTRIVHHPTNGHAGELHLLEVYLGIRHPILCLGEQRRERHGTNHVLTPNLVDSGMGPGIFLHGRIRYTGRAGDDRRGPTVRAVDMAGRVFTTSPRDADPGKVVTSSRDDMSCAFVGSCLAAHP